MTDAEIQEAELLAIEECDAWFEYLEACRASRGKSEADYLAVESWAWARLSQRRRRVRDGRHRIGAHA